MWSIYHWKTGTVFVIGRAGNVIAAGISTWLSIAFTINVVAEIQTIIDDMAGATGRT